MMKIDLVVLGKLKEKYLSDACGEYLKRLSGYCDVKITEIAPENLPQNPNELQIEAALKKEAEKIKKQIPEGAAVISLCVEGRQKSSEELAELIGDFCAEGKRLCFIIGSSHGLHESVKQMSDLRLSVSKMTFPHGLFRVLLLEQIYRAFKINSGGSYHK